jgi:hypothetical protein
MHQACDLLLYLYSPKAARKYPARSRTPTGTRAAPHLKYWEIPVCRYFSGFG